MGAGNIERLFQEAGIPFGHEALRGSKAVDEALGKILTDMGVAHPVPYVDKVDLLNRGVQEVLEGMPEAFGRTVSRTSGWYPLERTGKLPGNLDIDPKYGIAETSGTIAHTSGRAQGDDVDTTFAHATLLRGPWHSTVPGSRELDLAAQVSPEKTLMVKDHRWVAGTEDEPLGLLTDIVSDRTGGFQLATFKLHRPSQVAKTVTSGYAHVPGTDLARRTFTIAGGDVREIDPAEVTYPGLRGLMWNNGERTIRD